MKSLLLCSATLLAAVSLMAADQDDVTSAAQKLGASDSYSWTTTSGNGQYSGASHGKTQKDGLSWVDMTRGDNTTEAFFKGGKGALKTDDGWEALDLEAAAGGGGGGGGGGGRNPARFMAMRLRNFKAPAAEVQDLVGKMKDVTKTGDAYAGDLTEEGAKSLLSFGGRGRRGGGGGGGGAPTVSNAKGSVKFWIQDGTITKFEVKVSGTVSRNGNDRDIDRTTTTEIKAIGATKITVPDEAKSKMS